MIPNEGILINTLTLREAKDSSAVENIITTQDDLYKAELFTEIQLNSASKEVQDYAMALKQGFNRVRPDRLIRLQDILDIQASLKKNRVGLPKAPGTGLKSLVDRGGSLHPASGCAGGGKVDVQLGGLHQRRPTV